MAAATILDFCDRPMHLARFGIVVDCCLSYVPNLVQISLIIRDLDAISFVLFDDVTRKCRVKES